MKKLRNLLLVLLVAPCYSERFRMQYILRWEHKHPDQSTEPTSSVRIMKTTITAVELNSQQSRRPRLLSWEISPTH